MSEVVIKFLPLSNMFELPQKADPGSAGFDMRACIEQDKILLKGERALIPLGCAVEIPSGYEIQVRPRSGLALKNGVTILNSPGTIDSSYRGACGAIVFNASDEPFVIQPGMRICQWVVKEVPEVQLELTTVVSETTRGTGGFGSSGIN